MKLIWILLGVAIGTSVSDAKAIELHNMHEALKLLMEAKQNLEDAPSEHGGHRVEAIKLTKMAIKETELSINWTRQNDRR